MTTQRYFFSAVETGIGVGVGFNLDQYGNVIAITVYDDDGDIFTHAGTGARALAWARSRVAGIGVGGQEVFEPDHLYPAVETGIGVGVGFNLDQYGNVIAITAYDDSGNVLAHAGTRARALAWARDQVAGWAAELDARLAEAKF